jgi:hypothetical protein
VEAGAAAGRGFESEGGPIVSDERGDNSNAVGWAWPADCIQYHYFAGPRSLCRRVILGLSDALQLGEPAGACGECREVVRGWLRAKEGG